jgi:glycosyltransferase involved in cell wall biosynthesis
LTEEVLSRPPDVETPPEGFDTVQTRVQERMQEQLFRRLRPDRLVTPKEVSVVIPTLNEKEGIGKVIDDLKAAGFERILVVDGYSDDGTMAIAKSRGAEVIHQHGPGKAGALITAIDAVVTPYLLVMDGDDTYKATDALRLLEHAADFDEIIGARRKGKDSIPFLNRIGNWMISKTFKLFFDLPITDVLSGMYLLRTESAKQIGITSTSFDVEVDIAASLASTGRITEVPITYGDRLGTQKLKARDGGRIISTLFWMAYYYNSVLLYAGMLSLAFIPGAAILSWAIFEKMATNVWHGGYALVGVLLILFATQGLGAGIGSLQTKRSENRILRELRQVRI